MLLQRRQLTKFRGSSCIHTQFTCFTSSKVQILTPQELLLQGRKHTKFRGSPLPPHSRLRSGKVTLVNVFASWCGPCRDEHPVLIELSKNPDLARAGVRLVGLAYKDEPGNSMKFLKEMGNPFALIGVDRSGRVGIDWGVYGVPETFVVKGDGTIAYKFIGPLSPDALRAVLMPQIEKALR